MSGRPRSSRTMSGRWRLPALRAPSRPSRASIDAVAARRELATITRRVSSSSSTTRTVAPPRPTVAGSSCHAVSIGDGRGSRGSGRSRSMASPPSSLRRAVDAAARRLDQAPGPPRGRSRCPSGSRRAVPGPGRTSRRGSAGHVRDARAAVLDGQPDRCRRRRRRPTTRIGVPGARVLDRRSRATLVRPRRGRPGRPRPGIPPASTLERPVAEPRPQPVERPADEVVELEDVAFGAQRAGLDAATGRAGSSRGG